MTAASTIRWVPPAVVDALGQALARVLEQWAGAWGLDRDMPVRARALAAAEPALELAPLAWASASEPWRNALAEALLRLPCAPSPVSEGVARRSIAHLEELLAQHALSSSRGEAQTHAIGHRGVLLTFELLGETFGVELDCERLVDDGRLSMPAQVPPESFSAEAALKEVLVDLIAEVGRARVGAVDLMQLAPGDVLLLDTRLDDPLRVISPGSDLQLAARLGATAPATDVSIPGHRAIRWSLS